MSYEADTRQSITTTSVPSGVGYIRTAGYSALGDGGGGNYVRRASMPSHQGRVQSADGAWWELDELTPTVKMFGAKGNYVTDDRVAIQNALTYGNKITLDKGTFRTTGAITVNNTGIAAEPGNGTNYGTSIVGQGERYSVLKLFGAYPGISVEYGTGVSAHAEQHFSDFSINGNPGSVGLQFLNAAFLRVDRIGLYSNDYGLYGRSTLSSSFRDVRAAWGVYGAYFERGTGGWTNPNALLFENCNFQNNSNHGMVVLNPSNMQVIGGSIETNGTRGNQNTGGVYLTFNGGSEGASGATFIGTYFEGNKGGYDLKLENTGSTYVTVNLINCNFNRLDALDFVTHNIIATGKIYLNLINCTFKGFNSYSPSLSREYLAYNSSVVLQTYGSRFESALESPSSLANAFYTGSNDAGGVNARVPGGWTISKLINGVVLITHSLNTLEYTVNAVSISNDSYMVQRVPRNPNSFQIVTTDMAGNLVDCPVDWNLTLLSRA